MTVTVGVGVTPWPSSSRPSSDCLTEVRVTLTSYLTLSGKSSLILRENKTVFSREGHNIMVMLHVLMCHSTLFFGTKFTVIRI